MDIKRSWLLCLFGLFTALSGCAAAPEVILVQQSSIGNAGVFIPGWNTVFLLPPKLSYEDVQTEKELPSEQYCAKTISNNIVEFANNVISKKGFQVLQEIDLNADQVIKLTKVLPALSNQSEELAKQRKDKGVFRAHLRELYDSVGVELLLVQILKTKVGKGYYHDFYSGAIAPPTSTSHIIACLIDLKTEEVVWRNEVFFRQLPETKILNKSLEMLFSKFPSK